MKIIINYICTQNKITVYWDKEQEDGYTDIIKKIICLTKEKITDDKIKYRRSFKSIIGEIVVHLMMGNNNRTNPIDIELAPIKKMDYIIQYLVYNIVATLYIIFFRRSNETI